MTKEDVVVENAFELYKELKKLIESNKPYILTGKTWEDLTEDEKFICKKYVETLPIILLKVLIEAEMSMYDVNVNSLDMEKTSEFIHETALEYYKTLEKRVKLVINMGILKDNESKATS